MTKRTVLILLFLLVLNPVLGLYTMNTVNDDGYTGKDYSCAVWRNKQLQS